MNEVEEWFSGRLPEEWQVDGEVSLTVDREEIVVVLSIAGPGDSTASGEPSSEARAGRIARFREETRVRRMQIADEAEERFGRKVAWGATCGASTELFTHLAVPVMTRLRQPQRRVLDTLVEAGVARSRSAALAWCVELVGQHEQEWISRLRDALGAVDQARAEGPS